MKSINNIEDISIGNTISSDDMIEFHASRILLLIAICGKRDTERKQKKIEGFTKLAKLDFFIRYPEFFMKASYYLNKIETVKDITIESKMIRFHYGPWDKRYYEVLPYLQAKNLLEIQKVASTYNFYLTDSGMATAEKFMQSKSFLDLVEKIKRVKEVFGSMNGTKLKELIYELFDEEVKQKNLDEMIS
jgi:hypothetical protein